MVVVPNDRPSQDVIAQRIMATHCEISVRSNEAPRRHRIRSSAVGGGNTFALSWAPSNQIRVSVGTSLARPSLSSPAFDPRARHR